MLKTILNRLQPQAEDHCRRASRFQSRKGHHKSGLFFFENVLKDIIRWNKSIIQCHKVSNITISIIYIWNSLHVLDQWILFHTKRKKGGNFLEFQLKLFLHRNAYNHPILLCITFKLVKSYTNGDIWSNLARFYYWYKVCLSLKVKVTYQNTPAPPHPPPPTYAWDRKSENAFRMLK